MIELKNPVHPGEVLKHDIVEAHELSVGQAAQALGVSRQALSAVLNCKVSVTPDMATRFEKAFGVDMAMLLRMQTSFDIAQARQRAGAIQVTPYQPASPKVPQVELAL